jgi:hypothetical protein
MSKDTIYSIQCCPVCGGFEWRPIKWGSRLQPAGYVVLTEHCWPSPVIDAEIGTPGQYDECVRCGTVVI